MPDDILPSDWTHLHRLFKDMKLVADEHPDWVFMAADQPPRIGWAAWPLDRPHLMHRWTIQRSAVRQQDPFLKRELSEALRTPAGRKYLIELVIGRPGRPEEPPTRRYPAPTRYELLMED